MHLMADQRRIKIYLLCVICAVLGFYLAKLGFNYLAETQNKAISPVKPRQAATAPVTVPSPVTVPDARAESRAKKAPEKAPRPTLVLNGIVVSPGASYALINNKIVEEGDTVEGLKVVRITKENVELQDGDTAFKLSPNQKTF